MYVGSVPLIIVMKPPLMKRIGHARFTTPASRIVRDHLSLSYLLAELLLAGTLPFHVLVVIQKTGSAPQDSSGPAYAIGSRVSISMGNIAGTRSSTGRDVGAFSSARP